MFTHTGFNFFGPKVGFGIFRFEDGLIFEHRDNLAETANKSTSGGHTQVDGPTEIQDIDKTERKDTLAEEFVETILVKGQYNKYILSPMINGNIPVF